jgi:hypothetical protein
MFLHGRSISLKKRLMSCVSVINSSIFGARVFDPLRQSNLVKAHQVGAKPATMSGRQARSSE